MPDWKQSGMAFSHLARGLYNAAVVSTPNGLPRSLMPAHRQEAASFAALDDWNWTKLFRTFRIAFDPRKLILAAAALLIHAGGVWLMLNSLPFAPDLRTHPSVWPSERLSPRLYSPVQNKDGSHVAAADEFLRSPFVTAWRISLNGELVMKPVKDLTMPAIALLRPTPGEQAYPWAASAWWVTQLLWLLLVWGFFGGAMTRIAAVQFARGESPSLFSALAFSLRKFPSFLAAPLIPLSVLAALFLLSAAGGLIARIPFAGEMLVGVGYFIPLAIGVVMAMIAMGLAVGWPLMYATIATEDSDALDALSRSYAYVYDRPWYYAGLVLLAIAYGSIVMFVVAVGAELAVDFAGRSINFGAGETVAEVATRIGGPAEEHTSPLAKLVDQSLRGVHVLLIAFVYSYFWSANTVIYFLLRKRDDGVELDEIHLPPVDESDDFPPIAGVAASDQPVSERPATRETDESREDASKLEP